MHKWSINREDINIEHKEVILFKVNWILKEYTEDMYCREEKNTAAPHPGYSISKDRLRYCRSDGSAQYRRDGDIGVFRKLPQPSVSPAAPHPGQALLGAAELYSYLKNKNNLYINAYFHFQ